ncbi:MAG TPA: diaminopimelate decarboxylase, partial [Oscillatoriaceae cyanobacterium]
MPETRLAPNQALMPLTAHRSPAGSLVIGGCDTITLAERYGTPLYVLDEHTVRAACRAYTTALAEHYPAGGRVLYASKAHCTVALLAIVHQEGLGVDVVSAGELHTALHAGIPAEQLVLQGNNKTPDELEYALRVGIGRINVDNLDELAAIAALAERLDVSPKLLLRVAPGIEAHTHEFIRTGQEDSKFGLDLKSGQLEQAIAMFRSHPRLQWKGLQA